MNTKKSLSLMVIFALGLALSACGYRGPPRPPLGVEKTYPRDYPKSESHYPECCD